MSSAVAAKEPVAGFEELSPDQLEATRAGIAKDWTSLYRGKVEGQADEGAGPIAPLSAEDQTKADEYRARYDNIVALQEASAPRPKSNAHPVPETPLTAEVYDLLKGKALDAQAKRDADAYIGIMRAGRGEKDIPNPTKAWREHPGEVPLGQPLITFDRQAGRNVVHPFPFVPAERDAKDTADDAARKDIEASFRYGEMLQADKAHKYDPRTGNRLDRLSAREMLLAQEQTSDMNLTSIGGDLYAEMVRVDTFMSVCKIKQVPNLNQYKATGRTGIPTAGAFAEDGQLADDWAENWRAIDVDFKKYGGIIQYTHETTQTETNWSMAQLIAMDAGTALRNGFNRDLLTGPAAQNPNPQLRLLGFLTTIKASPGAYAHQGVAQTTFLKGANTFKIPQLVNFVTSIPKEYMSVPSKKLVMPLSIWASLMGLTDDRERKLFNESNSSVDDLQLAEYNVRVVLDDNLDDGNADDEVPMLFGDMQSFCVILAGGPRMDFSTEYGYRNDRLALRAIQHVGSAIVDTKGFKGYQINGA